MNYTDDPVRARAKLMGCNYSVEDIAVYEGRMFGAVYTTTAIAAGASYDLGILTTDTTMVYIPSTVVTSADSVTIGIYEGSTVTGGTTLASSSRQRNSSATSKVTLKTAPTVSDAGTFVISSYIGGVAGNPQSRQGGTESSGNKMVLKPNTQYLLRFTNGSTAANTIRVKMEWIESV